MVQHYRLLTAMPASWSQQRRYLHALLSERNRSANPFDVARSILAALTRALAVYMQIPINKNAIPGIPAPVSFRPQNLVVHAPDKLPSQVMPISARNRPCSTGPNVTLIRWGHGRAANKVACHLASPDGPARSIANFKCSNCTSVVKSAGGW